MPSPQAVLGLPQGAGMIRQRPLIAVVDDEESVRKSLRRLLVASQLDAMVYASGQEFLDSLGGRQPDCLVLDLQMPGLTGLEVHRTLAGARVRFPTIIITAHDEPETRARWLSAGLPSTRPRRTPRFRRRDARLPGTIESLRDPSPVCEIVARCLGIRASRRSSSVTRPFAPWATPPWFRSTSSVASSRRSRSSPRWSR